MPPVMNLNGEVIITYSMPASRTSTTEQPWPIANDPLYMPTPTSEAVPSLGEVIGRTGPHHSVKSGYEARLA